MLHALAGRGGVLHPQLQGHEARGALPRVPRAMAGAHLLLPDSNSVLRCAGRCRSDDAAHGLELKPSAAVALVKECNIFGSVKASGSPQFAHCVVQVLKRASDGSVTVFEELEERPSLRQVALEVIPKM
jgi:hypothetical protein